MAAHPFAGVVLAHAICGFEMQYKLSRAEKTGIIIFQNSSAEVHSYNTL